MKRAFYTTFYTAFCVAFLGCASGGHHSKTPPPSRLVAIDPDHDTMPTGFRPSIAAVLEKHHFTLTNGAPGALSLRTSLSRGIVVFDATVSLRSGTNIIADGGAVNVGTGTLVARDAAADAIVNRAIESFDKNLAKVPSPPR